MSSSASACTVTNGDASSFVPAPDGTVLLPLEAPPAPRPDPRADVGHGLLRRRSRSGPLHGRGDARRPVHLPGDGASPTSPACWPRSPCSRWVSRSSSRPLLARRFTTPLRQLTDASRDLAEGDLTRRVPAAQLRAGSSELGELAVQFNTMADRLEESVEIIRRDRDRSRDFLADVSHELRTPLAALRTFNELLMETAGDDPDARAEFLESSAGRSSASTGWPRTCWSCPSSIRVSSCSTCGPTTCGRPSSRPSISTRRRRRGAASRSSWTCRTPRSASGTTRSGSARS